MKCMKLRMVLLCIMSPRLRMVLLCMMSPLVRLTGMIARRNNNTTREDSGRKLSGSY
uniref:Uncharacterized protein n=1 Tax=Rhizophora mucronata TaxID=61149 RepID=A0A2P2QYJ7_RHIMU